MLRLSVSRVRFSHTEDERERFVMEKHGDNDMGQAVDPRSSSSTLSWSKPSVTR